jgi:cytochrome c oxidase assembly factor CtaG
VRPWGVDLKTDQEIAGLVMWVGMNTFFLLMLTIIFLRWATGEEARDKAELREETRVYRESRRALAESQNTSASAADLPSAHPITH